LPNQPRDFKSDACNLTSAFIANQGKLSTNNANHSTNASGKYPDKHPATASSNAAGTQRHDPINSDLALDEYRHVEKW
jgi:hypothetical protein